MMVGGAVEEIAGTPVTRSAGSADVTPAGDGDPLRLERPSAGAGGRLGVVAHRRRRATAALGDHDEIVPRCSGRRSRIDRSRRLVSCGSRASRRPTRAWTRQPATPAPAGSTSRPVTTPPRIQRRGDAGDDVAVESDRGGDRKGGAVGPVVPPLGCQRRSGSVAVEADVEGAGRQVAEPVGAVRRRGPAVREPPGSGDEVDPDRLGRTGHATPDLAGPPGGDVGPPSSSHLPRPRTGCRPGASGCSRRRCGGTPARTRGRSARRTRRRSRPVANRCRRSSRSRCRSPTPSPVDSALPGVTDLAPSGDGGIALGTEVHVGQGAGHEAGRARREVDAGAGLTRRQHDVGGIGRLDPWLQQVLTTSYPATHTR